METLETIKITYEMRASTGKRLANYLIDLIIRYAFFLIIGFLGALLYRLFCYITLYNWVVELESWEETLYGWMFLIVYYLLMESLTQRTLGKYITGTIVVMEDGSKPTFKTVFLRTLCRLIPFDGFSFLTEKPRGWHDRFVKTYVVDVKVYNSALLLKKSFEEIGVEQ